MGRKGLIHMSRPPITAGGNSFPSGNPSRKIPWASHFEPDQNDASDKINPHDTVLLDGGNGHELKQPGVTDGSFLAGLLANEQQPDIVQSVHCDFNETGCRIITTNSFVAVPKRILKDILRNDVKHELARQKTRELISAAVKCTKDAVKAKGVLVAGTVPPLTECYMASVVPVDPYAMVPTYNFLLSTLLAEGVDILLAETLSTQREAIAIVGALAQVSATAKRDLSDPLLAITMTIDDFRPRQLYAPVNGWTWRCTLS